MSQPRLAVLVSGTGSLLRAIWNNVDISLVLADRECEAIRKVAPAFRLEHALLQRAFDKAFSREAYTEEVLSLLESRHIDLVAMAGFQTILAPSMFTLYRDRVLNCHPSLLPAFKGRDAVEQALTYGVKVTGCTVHHATEEMDTGPIIAQEAVRVHVGDSPQTLHERIKRVERKLYPRVIAAKLNNM